MIWNMSEDDFDAVVSVHLKGHWKGGDGMFTVDELIETVPGSLMSGIVPVVPPVKVGEQVAVDLHICEGQNLPCTVNVRHVTEYGFGGEIVDIVPSDLSLIVQLIAEN